MPITTEVPQPVVVPAAASFVNRVPQPVFAFVISGVPRLSTGQIWPYSK